MPKSPQLRAVDSWVSAVHTFSAEQLVDITTSTFILDAVDENKRVHQFTRAQLFQHLNDQIKPHYSRMDVCSVIRCDDFHLLTC